MKNIQRSGRNESREREAAVRLWIVRDILRNTWRLRTARWEFFKLYHREPTHWEVKWCAVEGSAYFGNWFAKAVHN